LKTIGGISRKFFAYPASRNSLVDGQKEEIDPDEEKVEISRPFNQPCGRCRTLIIGPRQAIWDLDETNCLIFGA